MGRPLGVPNDAAFQRRVLLAALNLLAAPAGPVLADYAEDAPQVSEDETAGFACPVSFAQPALETGLARGHYSSRVDYWTLAAIPLREL